MNFLKTSISILFAATIASGAVFIVKPAIADSNNPMLAPSMLKKSVVNRAISESEVLAAQKAWGDALVAISSTYETKGLKTAKALAEKVLEILDSIPDGEIITRYFIGSPDSGKQIKSDVEIELSLLSPIVIPPQST